jgi:hypothetical protein
VETVNYQSENPTPFFDTFESTQHDSVACISAGVVYLDWDEVIETISVGTDSNEYYTVIRSISFNTSKTVQPKTIGSGGTIVKSTVNGILTGLRLKTGWYIDSISLRVLQPGNSPVSKDFIQRNYNEFNRPYVTP